ncbi:peptidoglycan recognition protein 1-like [Macrosteles quadrilineatus]|uniref:peptidoglycan recognition protein 1-like n=1 Tax=Macrosteles quadrilineatus TaxID=74068 RepID=UPI0023E2D95B|nr:peptidoglycan recognition protein 1-like [Macrosteles quadrilineatus]
MDSKMDDEELNYEKPFLWQDDDDDKVHDHPLESHPNWPDVSDPEIDAFEYETDEEDKPIYFDKDDMKVDPSKPDITYIVPWLRKYMEPPTLASMREGERLLKGKCYIDDDPRNLWLYKEYHGPVIGTVVRKEWGALPWKPKKPLNVPVKHVRFTYTNGPTDDYPEAMGIIQEMQKQHRKDGLDDIAYNYMISRDGAIFEGRGWYVDAERPPEFAHLQGDCLDIAYMGDFSKSDPPWFLLKGAMDVIRYAVEIRVLDPKFKVIPFRPHDQLPK